MSFLCMARTLGSLDKYGNCITLQSSVPALCVLVFMVDQNHSVSNDSCHSDTAKHVVHS